MNTGEDMQGMRKILDLSRWISVGFLLLHFYDSCKWMALAFLLISLLGVRGRKEETFTYRGGFWLILIGLLPYLSGTMIFSLNAEPMTLMCLYMGMTFIGYLLVLTGGVRLSRVISRSEQTTSAVDVATIANLSSGEFVGIVADDPELEIEFKAFHARIVKKKKQVKQSAGIPVVRQVDAAMIEANFQQVKREIEEMVIMENQRIAGDPALKNKVVKR
ncbi:MAG TPA: YWFCY domain-containing protein [Puia sp.]|nr:YWFCY domain-containing protein [Puia sp.]